MLKIRLTFVDDKEGITALGKFVSELENSFLIISKSSVYKGHGGSKYSNIYFDVDFK
ncbi:hypothetical protein GKZ28_09140 [Clostridium chromiireducens]|uniref:Uncharacterized protein n=1 Tax=Clostridium chromiireducens TaxID=225345 RepID=A0A964RLM0_9CLOT|nr:hypothetical protein [Clostridium chromiireducens]MVX63858.1 hypothetical protein [Clostridium chromiireducens]